MTGPSSVRTWGICRACNDRFVARPRQGARPIASACTSSIVVPAEDQVISVAIAWYFGPLGARSPRVQRDNVYGRGPARSFVSPRSVDEEFAVASSLCFTLMLCFQAQHRYAVNRRPRNFPALSI